VRGQLSTSLGVRIVFAVMLILAGVWRDGGVGEPDVRRKVPAATAGPALLDDLPKPAAISSSG